MYAKYAYGRSEPISTNMHVIRASQMKGICNIEECFTTVEFIHEFFIVLGGILALYIAWVVHRLRDMTDGIGHMLHVVIYHPDEIKPCEGHVVINMSKETDNQKTDSTWNRWDEG